MLSEGFKEELKVLVQLFKPRHLIAAMNQTKLMESTLETWGRKGKGRGQIFPPISLKRETVTQLLRGYQEMLGSKPYLLRGFPKLSMRPEERKGFVSPAIKSTLMDISVENYSKFKWMEKKSMIIGK